MQEITHFIVKKSVFDNIRGVQTASYVDLVLAIPNPNSKENIEAIHDKAVGYILDKYLSVLKDKTKFECYLNNWHIQWNSHTENHYKTESYTLHTGSDNTESGDIEFVEQVKLFA